MDNLFPNTHEAAEPAPRYDEGVLYANWNPAIELAVSNRQTGRTTGPQLSADLASVDVDAFLDRFYMLAARI